MAAGVTIKHKRKASAFSNGELAAGEFGLNTNNGVWYYSSDGSTTVSLDSLYYKVGGTDVAIADGGTGASTAAAAFSALKQAASETDTGVVERATDAEFTTGSDTTRYVSAAQVKSVAQVVTNKDLTSTTNTFATVTTTASSATPTPTGGSRENELYVTALAAGATFAAPSGSPSNGNKLIIRVKDNGTARSLAFNAIYRFSSDLPAPTTTILSKTLYMGFRYDSAASKWDCLAILNNFT